MIKLAIQPNYCGRERLAVLQSGYDYYVGELKSEEDVPVGSVEWCEKFLPSKPIPDYYPTFMNQLCRKVWRDNRIHQKCFAKPADQYKRFNGQIVDENTKLSGPFWCSEIVEFTNEYRFYVTAGIVKAVGWYDGEDENTPPYGNVDFPPYAYGAFDFGNLSDGSFALVEYQHPYACGWYGDSVDHKAYVQWLIDGWKWLKKEF
jgi:hypothetical protein